MRALTQYLLRMLLFPVWFRRNGESPIEGIDTLSIQNHSPTFSSVEMEKARLRALTHFVFIKSWHNSISRNGESPIKGIEKRNSIHALRSWMLFLFNV